jgi:lipooligosaccharide transport system permease protein
LTEADTADRLRPAARRRVGPLARQYDYWATTYRRTWKGSVISSFLLPLLYLAAMGVGLGSLVDGHAGSEALGGVSYLAYIAPGLLAATAMQTAVGEATYPIMGKIKWNYVFHAMVASPLRVRDIVVGQIGYIAFRVGTTCAVFLAVIAAFGAVHSPLGALCIVVELLVGLAFGAPIFALTARLDNEVGFALIFRLAIIPMFLFSGAFFPVSQLPDAIEWLAYLTPLWHGVVMSRDLCLGVATLWPTLGHAAYLLVWIGVGTWLAVRGLTRRLIR